MTSRARKLATWSEEVRGDKTNQMDVVTGGLNPTGGKLVGGLNSGWLRQVVGAGVTLDEAQRTEEPLIYGTTDAIIIGPLNRPDIFHSERGPTDTILRRYDISFQDGISDQWDVTTFGSGYNGNDGEVFVGTAGPGFQMTTGTDTAQDGVRYWHKTFASAISNAMFVNWHFQLDIGNVEYEIGFMGGTSTDPAVSVPDPSHRVGFLRQDTGAAATNWFVQSIGGPSSFVAEDTGTLGVTGVRRTFIIAAVAAEAPFGSDAYALKFYIGNNANNDPELVYTMRPDYVPNVSLHPYFQVRTLNGTTNKSMLLTNGQMKANY